MRSRNFKLAIISFYLLFGVMSQAQARCDAQFPTSFCVGPVDSNGQLTCRDEGPADGSYSCQLGSQQEFCSCINTSVSIKIFEATPTFDTGSTTSLAEAIPFASTALILSFSPGDTAVISSTSDGTGAIVIDNFMTINRENICEGITEQQGSCFGSVIRPSLPAGIPIETVITPIPPIDVTAFIPVGTATILFELHDFGLIAGNTDLFLNTSAIVNSSTLPSNGQDLGTIRKSLQALVSQVEQIGTEARRTRTIVGTIDQTVKKAGIQVQAVDQAVKAARKEVQVVGQTVKKTSIQVQAIDQAVRVNRKQVQAVDQNVKKASIQVQAVDQAVRVNRSQVLAVDQNVKKASIQVQAIDQSVRVNRRQVQVVDQTVRATRRQVQETALVTQKTLQAVTQ